MACILIHIILNSKFGNTVLVFSGYSNRKRQLDGETRTAVSVLGDTKTKDDESCLEGMTCFVRRQNKPVIKNRTHVQFKE